MAFTAVYDANVLHPASLRDLLIRLAARGLFRAKWTEAILDEAFESVLRANPELARERLDRTRAKMIQAVPDCLVTGYEPLIHAIELPDEDDRHVVAAAVRCHAGVIVTSNLRDFPADALEPFSIEAQSPDVFVLHLLGSARDEVIMAITKQAAALSQPPMTFDELLDRLSEVGLSRSVAAIRDRSSTAGWVQHIPEL